MKEPMGHSPAKKENAMPLGYEEFVIVRELAQKVSELQAHYQLFKHGQRVLDLGCGRGQYTKYIAEQGSIVVGLDSDTASIEEARQKYPSLEFRVADAVTMSPDEKYDTIFCNMVVCNIETEKRVRQTFTNVFTALESNGRFLVSNCDINSCYAKRLGM